MKILAILLLFLSSTLAQAQDYKCALHTTLGAKIIFFKWQHHPKQKLYREVSEGVQALPKNWQLKSVEECIELSKEFSHPIFRHLDLKTPK
ncbi:TapY2 family type IVa secretion system protein [Paraferrimonas sp. SM1919]|uniref:TapY2 family type IVa secretion system protein n=1 Tax=Paraferrimonas sp. SM1919 TaxID=2662263 RepID=UPI0013D56BDA|nr:TapY2 family type IVa secretion system protein [Paraferrimonas sp. SM1919]